MRVDGVAQIKIKGDDVSIRTASEQFLSKTTDEIINDAVFESAGPELHRTVLTFINEQCNASRAAAKLYTHRNTLLRRLVRADEMLPRPLASTSVLRAEASVALRGVPSSSNRSRAGLSGFASTRTPRRNCRNAWRGSRMFLVT